MGLVFMEFCNLGSYKVLIKYTCVFYYLFVILEILSKPSILILVVLKCYA